jgi:Rrf2 family protein
MKKNDPLSIILHALMHIAASPTRAMTSDALAECLETHPVVVRRTMARLRDSGLVQSSAGHGGGWSLARPAADISVGAVYAAIGHSLFQGGQGARADAQCLIERTIAGVMDDVVREAEARLAERLGRVSLADLAAQAEAIRTTQGKGNPHGR